jgi:hypothetical protein
LWSIYIPWHSRPFSALSVTFAPVISRVSCFLHQKKCMRHRIYTMHFFKTSFNYE